MLCNIVYLFFSIGRKNIEEFNKRPPKAPQLDAILLSHDCDDQGYTLLHGQSRDAHADINNKNKNTS